MTEEKKSIFLSLKGATLAAQTTVSISAQGDGVPVPDKKPVKDPPKKLTFAEIEENLPFDPALDADGVPIPPPTDEDLVHEELDALHARCSYLDELMKTRLTEVDGQISQAMKAVSTVDIAALRVETEVAKLKAAAASDLNWSNEIARMCKANTTQIDKLADSHRATVSKVNQQHEGFTTLFVEEFGKLQGLKSREPYLWMLSMVLWVTAMVEIYLQMK